MPGVSPALAAPKPFWRSPSILTCLAVWIALWIAFGCSFIAYQPIPSVSGPSPSHSATSPPYALPTPDRNPIPKIQHSFAAELPEQRVLRVARRDEIRALLLRDWNAYKSKGWGKAEISPLTGEPKDTYGGWAATIVDALDTLWIMELRDEFALAVDYAVGIDFSVMPAGHVSTFEATIRYLGGFLAAHDLSGDERLLGKAVEVATLLAKGFETPNRMPPPVLDEVALREGTTMASDEGSIASLGSMSLEYIRLAQVTGNATWYRNAERIMKVFEEWQDKTRLPGLWPAKPVNARNLSDFATGEGLFHLGGDSDSMYEYLIKADVLLGGSSFYEKLYSKAVETMATELLYRPMLPGNKHVLLTALAAVNETGVHHMHREDHLACFAGGMLTLGSVVLDNATHLDLGRRVTEGCIEMYHTSPLGIMPDEAFVLPCKNCTLTSGSDCCTFNNDTWLAECFSRFVGADDYNEQRQGCDSRLATGIIDVQNAEFKLRPEALESIFYLYRITGDESLPDKAWTMFEQIKKHTYTDVVNAAIMNVMDLVAPKKDEMESYWFAETLKYLYLIYSEPHVISLDEWVFNTEAHTLKRIHT
ncbi:putative glycosyl hydrolase family 47 protein 4 [Elsinoe fawcettii]|nr:putative glycosyl hydrolase family 47 protein 4 [Elsinoe fawcettii]